MKEFLDLVKNLVAGEYAHDDLKKLTTKGMHYLDEAKTWLDNLKEHGDLDKIAEVVNESTKKAHEDLANKFRTGELGKEYMDKVHKLTIMFPSELTDSFESFMKFFYDKYHK